MEVCWASSSFATKVRPDTADGPLLHLEMPWGESGNQLLGLQTWVAALLDTPWMQWSLNSSNSSAAVGIEVEILY